LLEVARSLGNDRSAWSGLAEACKILSQAGNDAVTLESYRQAIRQIESTWFMQPQDETSLRSYFGDKAELYDGLALCYQRLGDPAHAWQVLEAEKTRYLGDLITRRRAPPRESYSQVIEDVWAPVQRARASAEGHGEDVPSGLRELAGIEPTG